MYVPRYLTSHNRRVFHHAGSVKRYLKATITPFPRQSERESDAGEKNEVIGRDGEQHARSLSSIKIVQIVFLEEFSTL